MANKDRIADEVEKTLQSFDDDITLQDNPYLFARIKLARENRVPGSRKGVPLRTRLVQILAFLILLINAITVLHFLEWNKKSTLQDELVLALKEDFQIVQSQEPF